MTNYASNPDMELDYDTVEALGLDGTGRDGDPRAPYTWTKLTEAERERLISVEAQRATR